MTTLSEYWLDDRYTKTGLDSLIEMDFSGRSIDILGPYQGNDQMHLAQVIDLFEEMTGATVNYIPSSEFEQDIITRSATNNSADLSIIPQPGLLEALVYSDDVYQLDESVGDWIASNYSQGEYWRDLVSFDHGASEQFDTYGLVFNVNVKSLVWYSPGAFENSGYSIPETYEELFELTTTMVAAGDVPWALPLASGGTADGWPGTDWIESIILTTLGESTYDEWVSHALDFSSGSILDALTDFSFIVESAGGFNEPAILTERGFYEGLDMVYGASSAYMLNGASFLQSWWPTDATFGEDLSFFAMPPSEAIGERTMLVGGTSVAVTNDENIDVASAFIEYLMTPIAHEIWAGQPNSGFLTPLEGINTQLLIDYPLQSDLQQSLWNATSVRFDGSDLMPESISVGTFWSEILSFIDHGDAALMAERIDETWPSDTVRVYRGYEESNSHLYVGSETPETIRGEDGFDVIYGGAGDDIIYAGGGNDRIVAGSGAGNDVYYGEDGSDWITFLSATSGVRVDLANGLSRSLDINLDSGIGSDLIYTVENVLGGHHADYILGDAGDNTLDGDSGDDVLRGAAGNDQIIGGAGIDSAEYTSTAGLISLLATGNWTVITESEGTDTLEGIERLEFSNKSIALDLDGNAGLVAKILGAVFGADQVTNKEYAGIGLDYLDNKGYSYEGLMDLALKASGCVSNEDVVNKLYENVVGVAPTAGQSAPFIAILEGENPQHTWGSLGVMAADLELLTTKIDLTGLAETGLEYTPFG